MDTGKQIETKLGKARARLEEAKGAVEAAKASHDAAAKVYAASGTEKNGDTLDAAAKVLGRSKAALVACDREVGALERELYETQGREKRAAYDAAIAQVKDAVWLKAAKAAVPKVAEIDAQIERLKAERSALVTAAAGPTVQALADARRIGRDLGLDVESDLRAGALWFKSWNTDTGRACVRRVAEDVQQIVSGWIAERANLLRAGKKMPADSERNPYESEVA